MKILICGLPGSGKSTLAEPFAELLGAVWINADQVRTRYDDWDFSPEGRIRQANRMKHLSDGVVMAGKIAVADFVAPTDVARAEFDADYTVWMDTIKEGRFEDTNAMFEKPTDVDYHVNGWFDDTHKQLVKVVTNYMKRQDDIRNDRPEGFTMDNLVVGKK
jgi:adenylylsulfate kinase